MAGYARRVIKLDFPDLAEADDDIHIIIRNPKLVPPGELRRRDIKVGPDGMPEDMEEATSAGYEVLAKLIIGWRVYDATSTEDDQPRLGLPATAALVAKLPMEIINRLGVELSKVNPQKRTESPEATTSS